MAYDLLIKNGRVVDGTGELGFIADVAVQDGKIVGVGKYAGAAAKRTIDAEGRAVAPGFIDHHTHYDPQAVWDPLCSSSVQNGHTMVIVGQCGQVIAPTRPGDGAWYLEFFADAEAIPLSAMQAGALGFSTAPARRRDPAGCATDAERLALAGVLAELGTGLIQVSGGGLGGTKASHMLARLLSAGTGRPAIYNLLSQSIEKPEEHKEHLQWLADAFKSGARAYSSCTSCVQGPIFDLRLGLDVPQDED